MSKENPFGNVLPPRLQNNLFIVALCLNGIIFKFVTNKIKFNLLYGFFISKFYIFLPTAIFVIR